MLGFNRGHLIQVVVAFISIVVFGWIALAYFIPAPPKKITIATAFKGGSFEVYGNRYKDILARSNVELDVRITEGVSENIKLLNDPASGVQVAFLQGGISNRRESPDLISLGRINYQLFWIFCRAGETFESAKQLKGKRIAAGPLGSSTRSLAEKILSVSDLNRESETLLPAFGAAAVKALVERQVDAAFLLGALDSPLIKALLRNPAVRPVSFPRAEALTRVFPFLVRLDLPAGAVDIAQDIPPTDVAIVGTTLGVMARKELHPEIIYLLAQAMTEVHGDAGFFERAGEFPTQADPEYPMADGARDFYKNGPSFLNRYLPFWMTSYAQRVIALMATVVVIVLPLFSYAPKLFRWFVEMRLGAMYRRLRRIEAGLQKDVTLSEVLAMEAELENVERAIHILGVPMKHSDLFFSIMSHIDLVRTGIQSSRSKLHAQTSAAA